MSLWSSLPHPPAERVQLGERRNISALDGDAAGTRVAEFSRYSTEQLQPASDGKQVIIHASKTLLASPACTPPRLFASGSEVISSVLAVHPSFSVFRKSASSRESSMDNVSLGTSPHNAEDPPSRSKRADEDDIELASPARQSSPSASKTPVSAGHDSSSSSSFHLSMNSSDMASLNFGDDSTESNSSPHEPTTSASPGRRTPPQTSTSIRLVSDTSPMAARPSPSRSAPALSASSSSNRRSLRRSASSTRVQFSPLSLAPSPLLDLPPPPPLLLVPADAIDAIRAPSPVVKAILKPPRTPGTGQSVRFSSSVNASREASPSAVTIVVEPESSFSPSSFDEESSSVERRDETIAGIGAGAGRSFLSKLQAVIPSPDSSLVDAVAEAQHSPVPPSPPPQHNAVELDDPSLSLNALVIDTEEGDDGETNNKGLWEESNPFWMGASVSAMVSMNAVEPELPEPEMYEAEHERERYETQGLKLERQTPPPSYDGSSETSRKDSLEAEQVSTSGGTGSQIESRDQNAASLSARSDSSVSLTGSPTAVLPSPTIFATSTGGSSVSSPTASKPLLPPKQSSFYRQFLAKRAARNSVVAADELGRIMAVEAELSASVNTSMNASRSEGESSDAPQHSSTQHCPGTVQDEALSSDDDDDGDGEPSVYFSPEKSQYHSTYEDDEDVRADDGEDSFDIEDLRQTLEKCATPAADPSETDYQYDEAEEAHRRLLLSPIAEASEPNTTVNTVSPFINSPGLSATKPPAPPARPSFSSFMPPSRQMVVPSTPRTQSQAMTLSRSTPDSRIPRLTARRSAPPTPSLNPFALTNLSATATSSSTDNVTLVQQLLSTHSDLAANSSNQKFLLSSLVSNLQQEVERQGRVIDNLREQKAEVDSAWRTALGEVEAWEVSASGSQLETVSDQKRLRHEALQEVIANLTDELERRTKADRSQRLERDKEVDELRRETGRAQSGVRDAEIRLRHAQFSQAEAEEERRAANAKFEAIEAERDAVRKERDDARSKLRNELIERDRLIAELRLEVATAAATGSVVRAAIDGSGRDKLERQITQARQEAAQDLELFKAQLAESYEAMEALREEHRSQRERDANLIASLRTTNDQVTNELLEAIATANRLEWERDDAMCAKEQLQAELGSVQDRLESVEIELGRLKDEMTVQEDKLQLQASAWTEHQAGMADLLNSIAKMEADAVLRADELLKAKEDARRAQRESNVLVHDRDRRLAEVETALSSRIAKNEALVEECNRLKESVTNLRRQSADRELKYTKLKKIKSDLEEDIFGLNIALEAKQQEASTWKRQLASARLVEPSPAPAQSRRQSSHASTATPLPRSSKASVKSRTRPLSISSVSDIITPSRSAEPTLARRPSLGFGSSARREVSDPLPTPRRARSPSTASSGTKENVAPRRVPAQRRSLVPA